MYITIGRGRVLKIGIFGIMRIILAFIHCLVLGSLLSCSESHSSYQEREYSLVGFLNDSVAVLLSHRILLEESKTFLGTVDTEHKERAAFALVNYRGYPRLLQMDSVHFTYDSVKMEGYKVWAFRAERVELDQWDLYSFKRKRIQPTLKSDGCEVHLRHMAVRPGRNQGLLLVHQDLPSQRGFLDCAVGTWDTVSNTIVLEALAPSDTLLRHSHDALFIKDKLWHYRMPSDTVVAIYKNDSLVYEWDLASYLEPGTSFSIQSYWGQLCLDLQVPRSADRDPDQGGMLCVGSEKPIWTGKEFRYRNGTTLSYQGILP